MGLGTLVLTAVAFFILPRFGQPAWRSMIVPARQMVGYSGEVRARRVGPGHREPRGGHACRVDRRSDRPSPPGRRCHLSARNHPDPVPAIVAGVSRRTPLRPAPPRRRGPRHWAGRLGPSAAERRRPTPGPERGSLPRRPVRRARSGAAAARRRSARGRLSPPGVAGAGRAPPRRDFWAENYLPLEPVAAPPVGNVVDEKITIEPMNRPELFAVRPYFVTDAHPELHVDPKRDRLLREPNLCEQPLRLHVENDRVSPRSPGDAGPLRRAARRG